MTSSACCASTSPNEQVATGIAERVSAALSEAIVLGGEPIKVSACIGITINRDGPPAPDALIVEAETAMRRAKESGPGHHELFAEEMRARLSKRMEGEAALRRALENGEFRVVYQPKILLSTDRVVGVEALMRWEHPEKGVVPPLEFIPLAEETGLIVPIGAWVLQQACEEAQRWHAAAPDRPPLIVSVNVSGRQFESGLPELVAGVLGSTGIDPSTVCLEVTESVVMENAEFAITTLRQLKALGVRISIDDFGTGFSSLAYLRRFPLDELKVDKSFVDGLGRDPEATAIVAAVMGMAHALDLTVVAEGVETEAQAAALRNLGCDEAQGYLYARPQSARDLDPLLEQGIVTRGTNPGALGSSTVVVVDDAADIRQLARVSLAAAGFAVHEAGRGDEGLELTRRVMPDCVILDVNMPGSSGLEVCRALRADPLTSGMTIVMLTADALASDKVEAFALDADDYIVKPFAPRDLVSRVTSAMRRRREKGGGVGLRSPPLPPGGSDAGHPGSTAAGQALSARMRILARRMSRLPTGWLVTIFLLLTGLPILVLAYVGISLGSAAVSREADARVADTAALQRGPRPGGAPGRGGPGSVVRDPAEPGRGHGRRRPQALRPEDIG